MSLFMALTRSADHFQKSPIVGVKRKTYPHCRAYPGMTLSRRRACLVLVRLCRQFEVENRTSVDARLAEVIPDRHVQRLRLKHKGAASTIGQRSRKRHEDDQSDDCDNNYHDDHFWVAEALARDHERSGNVALASTKRHDPSRVGARTAEQPTNPKAQCDK